MSPIYTGDDREAGSRIVCGRGSVERVGEAAVQGPDWLQSQDWLGALHYCHKLVYHTPSMFLELCHSHTLQRWYYTTNNIMRAVNEVGKLIPADKDLSIPVPTKVRTQYLK